MEKYSIVIPVLNGEKTISHLIQSLHEQTFPPYEIIVVDNNSTDRTKEIIQNYSRVQYVFESKQGRSIARNKGASLALGNYICFVDSDVVLGPKWLEECDLYLRENDVDFFTTSIVPFSKKDGVLDRGRTLWGRWKTHGKFLSLLKYDNLFPVINTAACVVKKDIFDEFSGFDEKRFRNEDLELSIRLAMHGQILGGCSLAQAKVSFLEDVDLKKRLLAYLKRNIEIQIDLAKYNQFKFFSSIDFKYYFYLLLRGHFLLLNIALLNKLSGGFFAFPHYVRSSRKRESYSKFILFQYSFSDEGKTYFPKFPFILLNLDGNFYINSNSKKFYLVDKNIGLALVKLKNKKSIDQIEKQILLNSLLYTTVT